MEVQDQGVGGLAADMMGPMQRDELGLGVVGAAIPAGERNAPLVMGTTSAQIEAQKAAERARMAAVEEAAPQDETARLQAEIARLQAENKALREGRREVVRGIGRERLKKAVEAGKKVMGAVGEVVVVAAALTDADGRALIWQDVSEVSREAKSRAVETGNRAAKAGADVINWLDGKSVEVDETARAGANDLAEWTSAHIQEPAVKGWLNFRRFFGRLRHHADMKKVEDKLRGEARWQKAAGFVGRVARVMEDVTDSLERERFPMLAEVAGVGATKLAEVARDEAAVASGNARRLRMAKDQIQTLEGLREALAEKEKELAEERTRRANKFPNFMSRLKKLVGR